MAPDWKLGLGEPLLDLQVAHHHSFELNFQLEAGKQLRHQIHRITVLSSVTAVLISHHSTPYNFQCLTGAIRNVQPKHEDIDFSTMRLAPVLLFCFDSNLESLSFFVNLLGPK